MPLFFFFFFFYYHWGLSTACRPDNLFHQIFSILWQADFSISLLMYHPISEQNAIGREGGLEVSKEIMDSTKGFHDKEPKSLYLQKKRLQQKLIQKKKRIWKWDKSLWFSAIPTWRPGWRSTPFPPEDHHSAPATKLKSLKAGSYLPGFSH